jgi:hypothetical protein
MNDPLTPLQQATYSLQGAASAYQDASTAFGNTTEELRLAALAYSDKTDKGSARLKLAAKCHAYASRLATAAALSYVTAQRAFCELDLAAKREVLAENPSDAAVIAAVEQAEKDLAKWSPKAPVEAEPVEVVA